MKWRLVESGLVMSVGGLLGCCLEEKKSGTDRGRRILKYVEMVCGPASTGRN